MGRAGRGNWPVLQGREGGARLGLSLTLPFAATPALTTKGAGDPFPTLLRTLNALHLATAMAWRDHRAQPDLPKRPYRSGVLPFPCAARRHTPRSRSP